MSDNPKADSSADSAAAPLLVTAEDLAERLRVSKATLWRWRDSGKLPQPVAIGGVVRWRLADVHAWIAGGCKMVAPAPATE